MLLGWYRGRSSALKSISSRPGIDPQRGNSRESRIEAQLGENGVKDRVSRGRENNELVA